MSDLDVFISQLKSQHATLAKTFESEQRAAREQTAKARTARDALVAFRTRYGGHLKVIEQGSITVEE